MVEIQTLNKTVLNIQATIDLSLQVGIVSKNV